MTSPHPAAHYRHRLPRCRLGVPWTTPVMADPQKELPTRLLRPAASCLTPTALLDRTHRPVRDAAWDARRGQVPASLEGSNPLGVPLDRQAEWYQYHHLFRQLLGAEPRPCPTIPLPD